MNVVLVAVLNIVEEKMFLCDCQHFYALFANSFEGAAEEAALCTNSWKLGYPTIFQNLTDSSQNQHVFLLALQINKFKISKKSNEN